MRDENFEDWHSDIELWRLADSLSVVDAALLTVWINPGSVRLSHTNDILGSSLVEDGSNQTLDHSDLRRFRAVFKAIKQAVLHNRLSARMVYPARNAEENYAGWQPPFDHEQDVAYTHWVSIDNSDVTVLFAEADRDASHPLYIRKEPDWFETTVDTEHYVAWLRQRNFKSGFFFPEQRKEGLRDRSHPRYSSKLACAVAAWEAIEQPYPNKTIKKTVEAWVEVRGHEFDLQAEDGTIKQQVLDDISKVVNWHTKGGAPPTHSLGSDSDAQIEKVENYRKLDSDATASRKKDRGNSDLDDEIPF